MASVPQTLDVKLLGTSGSTLSNFILVIKFDPNSEIIPLDSVCNAIENCRIYNINGINQIVYSGSAAGNYWDKLGFFSFIPNNYKKQIGNLGSSAKYTVMVYDLCGNLKDSKTFTQSDLSTFGIYPYTPVLNYWAFGPYGYSYTDNL